MRFLVKAAPFALLFALSGCESGTTAVTNPADLAPLTETQKAEIKAADAAVEAEERGTPVTAKQAKAKAESEQ
jgi:hypothetical protein